MPMLHPCPRCTQALPASAKFCRRCGAAVGGIPSQPAPYAPTKPDSLLTAGLTALVFVALVVVGFTYWSANTPSASVMPVPPPTLVYPNNVPTQIVADPPVTTDSRFRFGAPVVRDGEPEHSRDHRDSERERSR